MADAPGNCPFCGRPSAIIINERQCWIECGDCPSQGVVGPFNTEAEAIAAWNTRATPPAAVVEAMERALRQADQVSRDLGWHRIYDETGDAIADLEAWRAGK